jgi:hypothetical protein
MDAGAFYELKINGASMKIKRPKLKKSLRGHPKKKYLNIKKRLHRKKSPSNENAVFIAKSCHDPYARQSASNHWSPGLVLRNR